jgi:hypothetical protein
MSSPMRDQLRLAGMEAGEFVHAPAMLHADSERDCDQSSHDQQASDCEAEHGRVLV